MHMGTKALPVTAGLLIFVNIIGYPAFELLWSFCCVTHLYVRIIYWAFTEVSQQRRRCVIW